MKRWRTRKGRCIPWQAFFREEHFPQESWSASAISISPRQNGEDSEETGYLRPGETIRGHEFHYWDSTDSGQSCRAMKPDGRRSWECIHMEGNLFAGYPHLYLPSLPAFAERFVKRCAEWRETAVQEESKMNLGEALQKIRPADRKSMEAAEQRWRTVGKPLFSLGKLGGRGDPHGGD